MEEMKFRLLIRRFFQETGSSYDGCVTQRGEQPWLAHFNPRCSFLPFNCLMSDTLSLGRGFSHVSIFFFFFSFFFFFFLFTAPFHDGRVRSYLNRFCAPPAQHIMGMLWRWSALGRVWYLGHVHWFCLAWIFQSYIYREKIWETMPFS